MRPLHDRLEPDRRLGFVDSPDDLDAVALTDVLEPDDVVLLKGSNRVFWARDFATRLRDALQARAV